MKELEQRVIDQCEQKDLWRKQTPQEIHDLLTEETQELEQALMGGYPLIEVASELGDVLYLLVRLSDSVGVDLHEALEMKIQRNAEKYPTDLVNQFETIDEAYEFCRQRWDDMGGDAAFFQRYTS